MTHGTDSLRGDVRIERDAERGQVQVAVDASELLARLEHPGGAPARAVQPAEGPGPQRGVHRRRHEHTVYLDSSHYPIRLLPQI